MSALAELARELGNGGGSSSTGATLVFGHVTKDTQHDGEVAVQADGCRSTRTIWALLKD